MGTIAPSSVSVEPNKVSITTWSPLATGDDGTPVGNASRADRSIQCTGTFSGCTVTMQGCNEATPVNWVALTDTAGNALTFTAAGLKQCLQVTRWIRPVVTAGSGSALIVTLLTVGK